MANIKSSTVIFPPGHFDFETYNNNILIKLGSSIPTAILRCSLELIVVHLWDTPHDIPIQLTAKFSCCTSGNARNMKGNKYGSQGIIKGWLKICFSPHRKAIGPMNWVSNTHFPISKINSNCGSAIWTRAWIPFQVIYIEGGACLMYVGVCLDNIIPSMPN